MGLSDDQLVGFCYITAKPGDGPPLCHISKVVSNIFPCLNCIADNYDVILNQTSGSVKGRSCESRGNVMANAKCVSTQITDRCRCETLAAELL